MKKNAANLIALLVIITLGAIYYFMNSGQGSKTRLSQQVSASATGDSTAAKNAGSGLLPGQDPRTVEWGGAAGALNPALAGSADVGNSARDMSWFYTRFGESTWFEESKFNVKTFTAAEYDNLIKNALDGNESATIALKLTIFKHLKQNPNDKDYADLRGKVHSADFLLKVPRIEYLADAMPNELTNDKAFVSELVKKNGSFLKYASERLRGDKEVLALAIQHGIFPLEYAADSIRGDRKYAEERIAEDPRALCYLTDQLRGDKGLIEKALAENPSKNKPREEGSRVFRCISDKLLDDKTFVLEYIKKWDMRLYPVSDKLKDDKDVVLTVLSKHPDGYGSASERMQNDPEALKYIRAYLMGPDQVGYAPLPKKLSGDRDVVKKVVANNCSLLQYASPELKDDEEIVNAAAAKGRGCLHYASERLQKANNYSENEGSEY